MVQRIIYIALFFISFSLWGQEVEISVSSEEVSVGQTITITIKSNIQGDVVENFPSAFVKGYGVNSHSQYIQDVNSGQMIQEHIISMSGIFSKAGSFNIGPFYVKNGNKSYKSNIVNVTVHKDAIASTEDFSKEQLRKPAFGIIERSADTIYEGQALVLNARVYSKFAPSGRPLLKKNYAVSGVVESHELNASGRIYVEDATIKGKKYATFEYDKRLIFPTNIGALQVEPFNIILPHRRGGYDIQSNVPEIVVKSLPKNPPKDFIGAVGKFDVSQNVELKNLQQGDVFKLDITIHGEGNLHNIEKPKLPLTDGMLVYGDPVVKEEFNYCSRGAKGKVIYSYNIQVAKEGKQTIPGISISYFDTQKEKYVTKQQDSTITIFVEDNPKFKDNAPNIKLEEEEILKDELAPIASYSKGKELSNWAGSSSFWISVGGPIGLAFLFLLFKKQQAGTEEERIAKSKYSETKNKLHQLHSSMKNELHGGNNSAFYQQLEKSANLLAITALQLDDKQIYTRNFLQKGLQEKGMTAINSWKIILESCDTARYGMAGNSAEREQSLETFEQLKNMWL